MSELFSRSDRCHKLLLCHHHYGRRCRHCFQGKSYGVAVDSCFWINSNAALVSSGYLTHRSLARHWQSHLPDATADGTSLKNTCAVPVPKRYRTILEVATACGDSDNLNWVASSLVRAPYSWSGGYGGVEARRRGHCQAKSL